MSPASLLALVSADLKAGDCGQLVAAQQLLQAHADPLPGSIHLQYPAPHLLALLVPVGAPPAAPTGHVRAWHQRSATSHQTCQHSLQHGRASVHHHNQHEQSSRHNTCLAESSPCLCDSQSKYQPARNGLCSLLAIVGIGRLHIRSDYISPGCYERSAYVDKLGKDGKADLMPGARETSMP